MYNICDLLIYIYIYIVGDNVAYYLDMLKIKLEM